MLNWQVTLLMAPNALCAQSKESELMALLQLRIKAKTLAAFMNMPKLPEDQPQCLIVMRSSADAEDLSGAS